MELTILGTSSMVPTKERNPLSVFLSYKGDGILFDCAEGTQRQMDMAGISRVKVKKILISHWHGDHVAGLIGLFQTIGNQAENPKIELFGPKGTKKFINNLLNSCAFDVKVDLKVKELNPKKVDKFLETDDYELYCTKLEHSVPCLGFSFVEKDRRNIDVSFLRKNKIKEGPYLENLKEGKDITYEGKKIKAKDATYSVRGKKISYVIDTVFTQNAVKLAKNADLLICEATYMNNLSEKAEKNRHMTAQEAGQIASQAEVKQLVLTHFSQRYKQVNELVDEARVIFPNTKAAFDLMKISL
ncbi:TPA: ribonuclease Z [Candidatus Woesearchaeota archaeon]|nr:ribonuclease Z [Candidatus Woesearchaeota archaeon]HIH39195.1 ribonuclease Z [Candidatus Woesearchaeota archaeon]